MTPDAILNAAQASGLILNAFGTSRANRADELAYELEAGQNQLRISQNQLATTQQALAATQKLRSTVASQAALAAARGQQLGQGSAMAATNTSLRNYNQDIQNLNYNQRAKEYELQFGTGLSRVRTSSAQANRNMEFAKSALNTVSINEAIQRFSNGLGLSKDVNVYGQ